MTLLECWQELEATVRNALTGLGLPGEVELVVPPDPELGDLGFPTFAYAKLMRKSPASIAEEISAAIAEAGGLISGAQAAGGYVNLSLNMTRIAELVLQEVLIKGDMFAAAQMESPRRWVVEYSAPNTNKPLHLGHVRNNLLGMSISNVAAYCGYDVTKLNLVNDRGIHICKTMLAYRNWGEGKTPATEGVKGDHFVGELYVRFDREFKKEFEAWKRETGLNPEEDAYFAQQSALGGEAQELLRKWEAGDEETLALWKTMNRWVLEGFEETYERMGCEFDEIQYESQTYKLGKELVLEGVSRGLFGTQEDGAVVFDLSKVGLNGEKILLRGDGTSLYMTQDIGTAVTRFEKYSPHQVVYVVGDEQLYHFQVLFKAISLLRPGLGQKCHHLSYGMVRLPEGRMKSREGTVVDADNLMDELKSMALEELKTRGESGMAHNEGLSPEEQAYRAERIGQAALKFFVLRFTPKKSFEYNPQQSLDFAGQTGPSCLYAYARTRSLLRKGGGSPAFDSVLARKLTHPMEIAVLRLLFDFPRVVERSMKQLDPSKVVEHAYALSSAFARMFTDKQSYPILTCEDEELKRARLLLVNAVGIGIRAALGLLGIEVLEEM